MQLSSDINIHNSCFFVKTASLELLEIHIFRPLNILETDTVISLPETTKI